MTGKAEDRNFSKADEVRVFPKGKLELLTIGGATIGRATLNRGGVGRRPFNRSQRQKAARRPISSITFREP